ncbi:MAG: hypothetical protein LBS03_11480 [Bacteroidales bacterium]|jgi:hypothetical protein|nr:hypothetical protein [Bacteroidales bacterium]
MNKFNWWLVLLLVACKGEEVAVYEPELLPAFRRVDFVTAGGDSSIFVYDGQMQLLSGRCHSATFGRERFTMQYSDGRPTGAEYETVIGTRDNPVPVSFSLNRHNMLLTLTREGWDKTFTFTYDDRFRLISFSVQLPQNGIYSSTISYDEQSNVSAVERYSNISGTQGATRTEFSDYDRHPNPFRLLVNVFYAPLFASAYGPLRYDNLGIPSGMVLSVNNPGKIIEYPDTGSSYERIFEYRYDSNGYPVSINCSADSSFPLSIVYGAF